MRLTDDLIIEAFKSGKFIRNDRWIKGHVIHSCKHSYVVYEEDIIELYVNGKYMRPYEFSVQDFESDKWSIVDNKTDKEIRKLSRALKEFNKYCEKIGCDNCPFNSGIPQNCNVKSLHKWKPVKRE